jgi:hypothetical protein
MVRRHQFWLWLTAVRTKRGQYVRVRYKNRHESYNTTIIEAEDKFFSVWMVRWRGSFNYKQHACTVHDTIIRKVNSRWNAVSWSGHVWWSPTNAVRMHIWNHLECSICVIKFSGMSICLSISLNIHVQCTCRTEYLVWKVSLAPMV